MNKNVFLNLLILALLTGCATTPDLSSNDHFITGKQKTHECYGVIERDGLIYMMKASTGTRNDRSMQIAIYDPDHGLFVNGLYSLPNKSNCQSIVKGFPYPRKGLMKSTVNIFQITDRQLMASLSDYRFADHNTIKSYKSLFLDWRVFNEVPRTLIESIDKDHAFANKIELYMKDPKFTDIIRMEGRIKQAKILRAKELANKEKEEKQRKDAVLEQMEAAKAVWTNRFLANRGIGDKVCTYNDNLFGYLEKIEGQKIKVLVVGKGHTQIRGMFFKGIERTYTQTPINQYRWMGVNDVAHCEFKN